MACCPSTPSLGRAPWTNWANSLQRWHLAKRPSLPCFMMARGVFVYPHSQCRAVIAWWPVRPRRFSFFHSLASSVLLLSLSSFAIFVTLPRPLCLPPSNLNFSFFFKIYFSTMSISSNCIPSCIQSHESHMLGGKLLPFIIIASPFARWNSPAALEYQPEFSSRGSYCFLSSGLSDSCQLLRLRVFQQEVYLCQQVNRWGIVTF